MKKLLFFLFLALAGFNHYSLYAQAYEEVTGLVGGGAQIFVSKNGTLVQFTERPEVKIHVSTDAGSTWQETNLPDEMLVRDCFSVGIDGNLYAVLNDHYYKSSDNGVSWNRFELNHSDVLVMDVLSNGTLLTISEESDDSRLLNVSINGGASWTETKFNCDIYRFFYNEANNMTYAYGDSMVYKLDAINLTWSEFAPISKIGIIRDINIEFGLNNEIIFPMEDKLAIIAVDGSVKYVSKFYDQYHHYELNICKTNDNKLILSAIDGNYISDDFGINWRPFVNDLPILLQNFVCTSSGILLANAYGYKYGSVYKSTDNGVTWTFSSNGLGTPVINDIDFISDDEFVVTTSDGVFITRDNGKHFNFLSHTLNNHIFYANSATCIYNDKIITGNQRGYELIDLQSGAVSQLIQYKNSSSVYNNSACLSNAALNLIIVYNNDNMRFEYTQDVGLTWHAIPNLEFCDLEILSDGSLLSAERNGVFKSTDLGLTKRKVLDGGFSRNIVVKNDYIYISKRVGAVWEMCSSIDLGEVWECAEILTSNVNPIAFDVSLCVSHNGFLFIENSVYDAIQMSTDQGRTFKSLGIYSTLDYHSKLDLSPGSYLYFVNGSGVLSRSKTSVPDYKFMDGRVYADGDKNCIAAQTENSVAGRVIVASKADRNVVVLSNRNGNFALPLNDVNFDLRVKSPSKYWASCVLNSGNDLNFAGKTFELGEQVLVKCHQLEVELSIPYLRRCFSQNMFVSYKNTGTMRANGVYVEIEIDPLTEIKSASIPYQLIQGNLYRFDIGSLDDLKSGQFTVEILVKCTSLIGQTHCFEAHIYPDQDCVDPDPLFITTHASCDGDSAIFTIRNSSNKSMSSYLNWGLETYESAYINLISKGQYKLNAKESFQFKTLINSDVRFTAEQIPAYTYNTKSQVLLSSCSSQVSVENKLSDEEPYIDYLCLPNVGSYDPNIIVAEPEGITSDHYIPESQELEYTIHFQNTGTDSAININIHNPLDMEKLDLTSFDYSASSHKCTYNITSKGILTINFPNIYLVDSNRNEKNSHGFFKYKISASPKLARGSKINNQAAIYFDFNDPVATNTTLHTIGLPLGTSTHDDVKNNATGLLLYPNPASQATVVSVQNPTVGVMYNIAIYDLSNQKISESKITNGQTKLITKDLIPNIYHVVLRDKQNRIIDTKRLMIAR